MFFVFLYLFVFVLGPYVVKIYAFYFAIPCYFMVFILLNFFVLCFYSSIPFFLCIYFFLRFFAIPCFSISLYFILLIISFLFMLLVFYSLSSFVYSLGLYKTNPFGCKIFTSPSENISLSAFCNSLLLQSSNV